MPEIRAGHWADQVRAWGEATDTEIPDGVGMLVAASESRAVKAGDIPQARRWRIKSLRLRGSIGIWRGGGGDEIAIDFDDYDAGLIGLVGSNGSGKTTLLENLTPWPTMLTRTGPLQDHFRLRDSRARAGAGRR